MYETEINNSTNYHLRAQINVKLQYSVVCSLWFVVPRAMLLQIQWSRIGFSMESIDYSHKLYFRFEHGIGDWGNYYENQSMNERRLQLKNGQINESQSHIKICIDNKWKQMVVLVLFLPKVIRKNPNFNRKMRCKVKEAFVWNKRSG